METECRHPEMPQRSEGLEGRRSHLSRLARRALAPQDDGHSAETPNNHMPTPVNTSPHSQRTLTQKLLWFAALWLLGTGSVAAVAYVLRLWIAPH